MKDHVFSGTDVAEALSLAAANLGLPLAELRYVVLEPGTAGGRGLKPTPARIAVLLHEAKAAGPAGGPVAGPVGRRVAGPGAVAALPARVQAEDPLAGIESTLRAIAAAGDLAVTAEVAAGAEAVVVQLHGDDRAFFLEPDGRAEVLRATEHLLLRLYGAALKPLALRLTGEGFRERRDEALMAEARRVAEAVRSDGRARVMGGLNSYERRVVHLALEHEPGIATASAGEGAERRLTVAPLDPPGEPAAE